MSSVVGPVSLGLCCVNQTARYNPVEKYGFDLRVVGLVNLWGQHCIVLRHPGLQVPHWKAFRDAAAILVECGMDLACPIRDAGSVKRTTANVHR